MAIEAMRAHFAHDHDLIYTIVKNHRGKLSEWEMNTIWYLNTGASNHMTGCSELFSDLDMLVRGSVRLAMDLMWKSAAVA